MSNTPYIKVLPFLLMLTAALLFSLPSFALDVTLQWDENTEPDIAGYIIYWGLTTGSYDTLVSITKTQDESPDPGTHEWTLTDLPDCDSLFFAVAAEDDQERQSDYSNEVNTKGGLTNVTGESIPNNP